MRLMTATCIAATITELGVEAIHLQHRAPGQEPRTVHQHIQRRQVADPVARDRRRWRHKRQSGTLNVPLNNELFLYYMDMTVGSPEQRFQVHLDTGSSDLWLNVANSSYCSSRQDPCQSGTYDPDNSDTYQFINSDFVITYADGSGSSGDYVTDTVRFGDVTLENQQFGVGYVSTTQDGILGIGYTSNEVAVSYGEDPYDNIPTKLVSDGHIATAAYSLWLNDLEAAEGSILFGGVNTEKYQGELETIPIVTIGGAYRQFLIPLLGVGRSGQRDSISGEISNLYIHLDSGASLTYLPDTVTANVYDALNAQYDAQSELAFVDCDLAAEHETLDFRFQNDKTIQVPMNELIFPYDRTSCVLGILPSGDSSSSQEAYYILGDTVLRSAYVVYDMAQNEISIAQTIFNSTEDNIVALGRNQDVPDEPGADGETIPATAVGSGNTPGQSTSEGSSTSGSSQTPSPAVVPQGFSPSMDSGAETQTVTVTVANPSVTGESAARPTFLVGGSLLLGAAAIAGVFAL